MCLGVPGKIVKVEENPLGMTMGKVDFAGILKAHLRDRVEKHGSSLACRLLGGLQLPGRDQPPGGGSHQGERQQGDQVTYAESRW